MKVSLSETLKNIAAYATALGMICAVSSPLMMAGCERQKTVGDRVDDAGDAAGDAIDDAVDAVDDAVDRVNDG